MVMGLLWFVYFLHISIIIAYTDGITQKWNECWPMHGDESRYSVCLIRSVRAGRNLLVSWRSWDCS